MPVLETKGALSAQGFGLTTATPRNYIEDVFSTWLYTGNGSTQTITNGIDLSGKGGLVWVKPRSGTYGTNPHRIFDTIRGGGRYIASNDTAAEVDSGTIVPSFTSSGFNLDSGTYNNSVTTYASWTFREQPKFFDVVTYTGTGANRTIAHNLGSVPGCIFVKRTDAVADWQVYHRSLANTQYMVLNTTAAVATGATRWNSTTPTSAVFSVGTDTTVNASGGTYVAYIFAHDAGGFGNSGADNVISCGSFTTDAGGASPFVSLGYEPQFLIYKDANYTTGTGGDWNIVDNMRSGLTAYGTSLSASPMLEANTSAAEQATTGLANATATGFYSGGAASHTHIYIAIRRGPMKTPTVGTSVFQTRTRTGTGAATSYSANNVIDSLWTVFRGAPDGGTITPFDRLRGNRKSLLTFSAGPENTAFGAANPQINFVGTNSQTLVSFLGPDWNNSGQDFVDWIYTRAPGFFDEVCYTGTSIARTISHNLAIVPQLIIAKQRSGTNDWQVYSSALANTQYLVLNSSAAVATGAMRWNSTTPTSSVFSLGTDATVNNSGQTYISYLFASVVGVSKVGSYTGTGALQTVDCGFTTGARFVLIKRTDSTGDWYAWDSARGIVAGNDPYIVLNSTAAEVTTTDWVDTAASGFELSNAVGNLANVVGGTYIFLSVA
jgi:hypothetical protein